MDADILGLTRKIVAAWQAITSSLASMQKAFGNWLWFEIEEFWSDIVESAGFDFRRRLAG